MKHTNGIICELNKILFEKEPLRSDLIKHFQDKIWSDEIIEDETLEEILTELAYDLDFYEPNEDWRKQSPSYYDSGKLEEVIKLNIKRIENYTNSHL